MSDDLPYVSVVIPAYNEEAVVDDVVRRVSSGLAEVGVSAEILVVDDGSSDRTAEVAAGAGARVITHPYNIGNDAAVKAGIRHARGEILVMLDVYCFRPKWNITSNEIV